MERVKKGEKYWIITQIGLDYCCVPIIAGEFQELDDDACNKGNRFHTKEEAEVMIKRIRAVFNGADVIEMPTEEELENVMPEFSNPQNEDERVGWIKCYRWLKSKIVE